MLKFVLIHRKENGKIMKKMDINIVGQKMRKVI
jgi:hypothetical protein